MSAYDFNVTGTTLIADAMELIGAKEESEAISGDQTTTALRFLNMLAKAWQAQGYHRHRKQEVVIPLVKGQRQYFLGPASTDAEWADENDFFNTLLNGAVASGRVLTVDSTANMSSGDRIGVELTDNTMHWTTISSITSTTALMITTAIVSAASDNGIVYSYTSRPQRPLRILHSRRRSTPSANDVETWKLSDEEYQSQPSKETEGTPVNYNYKPAKSDGTLTSGTLSVWQPPGNSKVQLRLTVERPTKDFDAAGDALDWPAEWALAFTYNLATLLEPQHGVIGAQRVRDLRDDARMYLGQVSTFDLDTGPIRFQPRRY